MGTLIESYGPATFGSPEEENIAITKLTDQIITVNSLYKRNHVYIGAMFVVGVLGWVFVVIGGYLNLNLFAYMFPAMLAVAAVGILLNCLYSYPVGRRRMALISLGLFAAPLPLMLGAFQPSSIFAWLMWAVSAFILYRVFRTGGRLLWEMTSYRNTKVPPYFW